MQSGYLSPFVLALVIHQVAPGCYHLLVVPNWYSKQVELHIFCIKEQKTTLIICKIYNFWHKYTPCNFSKDHLINWTHHFAREPCHFPDRLCLELYMSPIFHPKELATNIPYFHVHKPRLLLISNGVLTRRVHEEGLYTRKAYTRGTLIHKLGLYTSFFNIRDIHIELWGGGLSHLS